MPDKEEIELLQSHKHQTWWGSYTKLTRNSIAIMFAHISNDNREFAQEYINNLVNLISQDRSLNTHQYERPLLRIVQVQDKLQPERIKRVLTKLTELFKNSTSCYMFADSIIEIVFKLAIRCPQVAKAFAKNHVDLFNLIKRFTKENPTLPMGPSKMRIFRESPNIRWNDIKPTLLNQQSKFVSILANLLFRDHLDHKLRGRQDKQTPCPSLEDSNRVRKSRTAGRSLRLHVPSTATRRRRPSYELVATRLICPPCPQPRGAA